MAKINWLSKNEVPGIIAGVFLPIKQEAFPTTGMPLFLSALEYRLYIFLLFVLLISDLSTPAWFKLRTCSVLFRLGLCTLD
jgi:hypothetical protein